MGSTLNNAEKGEVVEGEVVEGEGEVVEREGEVVEGEGKKVLILCTSRNSFNHEVYNSTSKTLTHSSSVALAMLQSCHL